MVSKARRGVIPGGRTLGVILALVLLLLPAIPETTTAAGLTIRTAEAVADFPNGITFTLVADADQPITALELRYHPTYSPITRVARPSFTPGTTIELTYLLDLELNYLPPGIDVVYRWLFTLQDGSVVETPEQAVFYMDPLRDWQTLQRDNVTLYYYAGSAEFAQEALDTTVASIERFEQTFDVRSERPLRVVMYGSERDFLSVLPFNTDEWVGGFADPELSLIVVAIAPGNTSEIHRMLSHEVVHMVMAEATDNPFNSPPPWLNEGLASYYQDIPDDRFQPYLQRAVQAGQLDSVRALNSSFPSDPTAALLAYAESESIVQFIIEEKGAEAMGDLIRVFREGVSTDTAVEHALGISIEQLDYEWKQWLGYPGDSPSLGTTTGPIDPQDSRLAGLLQHGMNATMVLLAIGAGGLVVLRLRRVDDESEGDPAA